MSGADRTTHDLPVPSASSSLASLPTTPPKRFLGATRKLGLSTPSLIPLKTSSPLVPLSTPTRPAAAVPTPSELKSQEPSVSPPKLTRIPTVVLTPVDITKFKEAQAVSTPSTSKVLPLPPPLTKMPISTRKDKRAATPSNVARDEELESTEHTADNPQEPPKKRARAESGKAGASAEATTPRKIIQEIFGPDKSKRSKGKGRKKRRGAPTPRKKILAQDPSTCQRDVEVEAEDEHDEDEEHQQKEEQLNEVQIKEEVEQLDSEQLEVEDAEADAEVMATMEHVTVKSEMDDEVDRREEVDEEQDETESLASTSSRRFSRRKAMVKANERLKRISQDECGQKCDYAATTVSEDGESETKEETRAASIQSRRSTTEGSSKSGSSSLAHPDSESSMGMLIGSRLTARRLRELEEERRRFNRTPLTSDDEDGKGDGVDLQEHKDSDVDSTYSWKPVRAAAAAALEQVTKNQGSNGSTGLPGDAEAKAAAAAERRARKINRLKGRNRRTLTFKTSSSKKYTAMKHSRYTAQPTIAPQVFHHGHYFQAGDIVNVGLADDTPMYGQIRGLLMDHYGEISAGIRFLAPKHPIYAVMDFEPINYAFRYDVSESLIKIDHVNFVMHLNLDHFDGHPSFKKIERNSVYTRMGKSLHPSFGDSETEDSASSSSDSEDDSSDSEDENGIKRKKDKHDYEGKKATRRRHLSVSSSTDAENDQEHTEKLQDIQSMIAKEDDDSENAPISTESEPTAAAV